jgi:hypothetical protein
MKDERQGEDGPLQPLPRRTGCPPRYLKNQSNVPQLGKDTEHFETGFCLAQPSRGFRIAE